MTALTRSASRDTLNARSIEQRLYKIYTELEERDGDQPSDLGMAARLAWMESGRTLERLCEKDGISRWNYDWSRCA